MNSSEPYFSIIIPTYNRSTFLTRAILSIQNQTYGNYELIVVDDGSEDETELLCKLYDINYIRTENHGVSHARNYGAKKAKGKWLAFLDSDDEWLPEKLQKQKAYIESNPGIRIVHGNENWIRNDKIINQKKKHRKSGGDIFNQSLKLCLISPSAVAIRIDLFREMGGFREDFPVCEDYDLWLKISAREEVGFIDDVVINKYGGHEDQLSSKYVAMDYWRVISIDWTLKNTTIEPLKRKVAIRVLLKKSEILLRGYKKHKNMEQYEKIQKISKTYINIET